MTDEEVNAAWALVNATTSGPWEWTEAPRSIGSGEFLWCREHDEGVLNHADTRWPVSPENRAFIAASRTLVVTLLNEIERLRVKIDSADRDLVVEVCHDLMGRALRNESDEFSDDAYSKIYRDQEKALRILLALTEGR